MARFALHKESRDFFQNNHYLELEAVLSSSVLEALAQSVEDRLSFRLGVAPSLATAEELLQAGRDLRFDSGVVEKVSRDRGLANLASELMGGTQLRLACDQILPGVKGALSEPVARPLSEGLCFQGIVGGWLICLRPWEQAPPPYPKVVGNAAFLHADCPFAFHQVLEGDGLYLLLVYGKDKSVYIWNEHDFAIHSLKRRGFTIGDRLRGDHHPLFLSR